MPEKLLQRTGLTTDWVRWAVAALLVAGLFCPYLTSSHAAAAPAPAKAPAARVERSQTTTEIQYKLRSYGYTIVVDGIYGPQTTRVVKAWQKANGLDVDGVAGLKTLDSLGLSATATVPAVRVNPPAPPTEPVGDVEGIIRDVWPDDLEDWAVRIAKRESGPNLKVDAANWCCYGIFQVYFSVHRAWLADYGVDEPSDLFDPRVNATVALALYGQVGCRPWGC